MIIIGNGKVITRNPKLPYFNKGGVAVEGTKIVEVGISDNLIDKYPRAQFVDAKGGIIMPGFINAHSHIYSALARGLFERALKTEKPDAEIRLPEYPPELGALIHLMKKSGTLTPETLLTLKNTYKEMHL